MKRQTRMISADLQKSGKSVRLNGETAMKSTHQLYLRCSYI